MYSYTHTTLTSHTHSPYTHTHTTHTCMHTHTYTYHTHRKHIHTHSYPHTPTHPSHRSGLIDAEEKEALDELYNYNPLLFDLACKRLIKNSSGYTFPASIFREHPLLPPIRKTPFNIRGTSVDPPGTTCIYMS